MTYTLFTVWQAIAYTEDLWVILISALHQNIFVLNCRENLRSDHSWKWKSFNTSSCTWYDSKIVWWIPYTGIFWWVQAVWIFSWIKRSTIWTVFIQKMQYLYCQMEYFYEGTVQVFVENERMTNCVVRCEEAYSCFCLLIS